MTNADGPIMMMKEIVRLEKPEDIVGRIAMRRSTSAVPRTECNKKKKEAANVSVFKRLGPLPPQSKRAESPRWADLEDSEDEGLEDDEDRNHRPRWCPDGLSRSQKRRVQRLRGLEEAESILGRCLHPDGPHHHHRRASRFRLDGDSAPSTVSDNAGCFADRPFPAGGSVISFGGSTSTSPSPHRRATRGRCCAALALLREPGSSAPASPAVVQVMMAGDELPTKNPRTRGPGLERNIDPNASGSGPKAPPPPSRLDAVRAKLSTPLTPGADPTAIEADLEAHRQLLLKQTEELAAAKRQMEITQREYNRAHGLTPGGDEPSRAGHIRRRGRDLGAEIARDGAPSPAPSAELPVYNTPDKNMRAAEAAAEELNRLEGEELRRQTRRVTELLNAANRQIADPRYVNAPRASHARGAAGNDREGARDTAESSSPAPSRRHDSRATHSSGRPSHQPSGSSRSRPPPSRNQEQDSGPRRHHRPAPEASGARQPAHSRLGPRIEPADARDRLDRLVQSRIAEEEGPAGPKCFGPRILNEPMVDGFQLPRDTPKYDGTAKPEDWLLDYSTAVGIAKGNKRWAVRYSPLMLLGSARMWLNNLPAGSINGWLDFEAAFISNFTGTYRRPGRPQQLEMCKQGPDETDRAYLTRWCEMRNSCEGVHEMQAISFFMGGCRPNTMLWHKLRRSEPKTMAALMVIADKYALAEEAGKAPLMFHRPQQDGTTTSRPRAPRTAAGGTTTAASVTATSRTAGTCSAVAAVADNAAGGSRRQKQDRQWKPKYTFEQMLDSPCKYHSGKNPSNHTTRDCHFMKRLTAVNPSRLPALHQPAGRVAKPAQRTPTSSTTRLTKCTMPADIWPKTPPTSSSPPSPRTGRAKSAVPSRSTRSYRRSPST
ncbi:hypothetical protein QYE76_068205 [Lolium multiflorum]|uniref:Retrotransposon gag domain-containing protein n=1 Tax=Lolium multiflorum TaxID=4521 RepID=A0AAD8SGA8_LOLMU|nr:hypothetical protein QYE76_068205 [Lolium multiflorum]